MCKSPIIWLGDMYLLAPSHYPYIQCRSNKQKRCGGRGRATTRAHPPHPLPARPYYRTIPVAPLRRRGVVGAAGRPQGPTHHILSPLAPTILRSLLLRVSEGRETIRAYLNAIDHKGT